MEEINTTSATSYGDIHHEFIFNLDKASLMRHAHKNVEGPSAKFAKVVEDTEDKLSYRLDLDLAGANLHVHSLVSLTFEALDENTTKVIIDVDKSDNPERDIKSYQAFFDRFIKKELKVRAKEEKKAAKKAAKEAKKAAKNK